ncbi:hypothetical protein HRG_012848 [Hirsutella rhossiliensis]
MSSPSRENLRVLAKVNTESIAMASHSQGIVSDKNSRTQAYANRMKRGKIVRPRGEFITSSSMADITGSLDLDKHSEDGADDEDEDNLLDTQENIPSSPPLAAVEAVVDTPCPRPRTRSSNKIQQTLQEHRYG